MRCLYDTLVDDRQSLQLILNIPCFLYSIIGAIYAFGTFTVFDCKSEDSALSCGPKIYIPVLVFWVLVCAFFREGPRHGYAAVVSAFTPIILFLGSATGLMGAWKRIEQTFLGIAIYLLVDNLIYPKRIYHYIKVSVLASTDSTRLLISESSIALEKLVSLIEYHSEEAAGGNSVAAKANSRVVSFSKNMGDSDTLLPVVSKHHRTLSGL
jgi:hypothetical protein